MNSLVATTLSILIALFMEIAIVDASSIPSKNNTKNNNNTKIFNRHDDSYLKKTNFKNIGLRAIYVLTAVSGIVILYLIVRTICRRRRKNRTRRYGILSGEARDNMEMKPLSEQDDDDEDDMTLFDMSKRKGKR